MRPSARCGVSHVIQCWYFGNYPGAMNRAAGALAYEDFSSSEEEFLTRLAGPEWGPRAADMAEVWKMLCSPGSSLIDSVLPGNMWEESTNRTSPISPRFILLFSS